MAYVTAVTQLDDISAESRRFRVCTHRKIIANPQIFKSRAGFINRFRLNGSESPSERSRLIRRTMKAHSFSVKNLHDLCALSGKSTRKINARMPITPVITPSRMKIHLQPSNPSRPSACISPKARIPDNAEATQPIR